MTTRIMGWGLLIGSLIWFSIASIAENIEVPTTTMIVGNAVAGIAGAILIHKHEVKP